MKKIAGFSVFIGMLLPFAASAQSVSDLQQQVQDLLARIATLQQQINIANASGAAPTSVPVANPVATPALTSSACPFLGSSLRQGASGDDVTRLQQFLARDPAIYPEGKITGYYGALTEAAVQRWQAKNNIVSAGAPESTGYGVVGPRTAAAMSLVCTQAGQILGTVGVSGPVGGFIQVTPVTGNSPLPVAIQVTVNTTNSCSGATYTLDYGDNSGTSQIVVPVGNCYQMNQTVGHTYQYGGTYQITLSAGEHHTSATVTVSGPPAPSSTVGSPTSARGTFSAFVTSGQAPFTTTFYISCGAGVAYNVIFGDGSELGSAGVANSSCTGSLQAVSHTYANPGNYTAQLVIFVQQSNGTVAPVTIASLTMNANSGSADGSGLGGLSLTPNVNNNPKQVEARFDIGNCQSYSVAWGDGQTSQGSPACSGGNSTITTNHTYAASGSYSIVLTRGSRTDNVAIVISN